LSLVLNLKSANSSQREQGERSRMQRFLLLYRFVRTQANVWVRCIVPFMGRGSCVYRWQACWASGW